MYKTPYIRYSLKYELKIYLLIKTCGVIISIKIKEHDEKVHALYTLGVDILDFDNSFSQLEKSIPTLLRKEKDEQFGYIQDLVGWWLYEDVDKVIWIDEFEIKVDNVEEFTDYLIREYGTNDIPTN
jgi:hypothetical protein